MMSIELKEPDLIKRVEALASEGTQPAEQILEEAVRTYLDEIERQAIQAETQAFWAMHEELLQSYPGEHVALYQGQVVDHDASAASLEKRVRERFGILPVLIAPVRPGPRRDLRWLGGRVESLEPVQ
jgi:predicted transcriptional regulator